ncbi:RagB/SusD family nutrient uptake outer membrane protein [Chishuiella changwenlii]|uniref:RagB/SusD family nutrient uptake outer membrane protein n=1 Tax=Chishuiella changwenlii TaxID=1434701 RepID=UPI002FDADD9D
MKKKIFLSLLTLSFALSFTSCNEDDLQLDSPNDLNDNTFWKTDQDFEIAVKGVYDGFKSLGFYGGSSNARDMIIVGDLLSDNLVFNPGGRRTNYLSSYFAYNSNSTPTDVYQYGYVIISNANMILSKIDNLPAGATKDKFAAEAKALRAIAHFEIAKAYAQIPTQAAGSANSVGIPFINTYDPKGTVTRDATINEVYTKIINDLESVLPSLPTANYQSAASNSNAYYRLNQTSLRGILAKIYLYVGNYPKVIEHATPVVNAVVPTNKDSLDEFWKTETNQGALIVFPFFRTNDLQLGTNYSQGTSPSNYRFEYSVDKALYDLYNPTTEPERLSTSIITTPTIYDTAPQHAVAKYMVSRTGYNAGVNDGRYLRVEDVILTLAEAQYLSGNQAGALVTLNKLRDARYTSYAGGETGDALFEAIITERRKELAFEGDRFYTIKRLMGVSGIPAKYAQGLQRAGNGHRADGSGTVSPTQSLPKSSHLWQFPIPQAIINIDKISQTDGY